MPDILATFIIHMDTVAVDLQPYEGLQILREVEAQFCTSYVFQVKISVKHKFLVLGFLCWV